MTQQQSPEQFYREFSAKLAADREADAQRAQAAALAAQQANDLRGIVSPEKLYRLAAEQRQDADDQQITDKANAMIARLGLNEDDPELQEAYREMEDAAELGRQDLYLGALNKAASKKADRLAGRVPKVSMSSADAWAEVNRLARAGTL